MAKCKGKTKSNKPCQREGGDDGWCYQHRPGYEPDNDLTAKRQRFVELYPIYLNGAKAAREAGFAEATANREAHRLLSDADIKKAIEERLEKLSMSKDEVLARLTRMARGSLEPFINTLNDEVIIDLTGVEAQDSLDLLKEVQIDDGQVKIKIHDPMAALVHIGRAHAMFTDNQQLTVKRPEEDMSEEELEKEIERLDDIIDDAG